MAQRLRKGPLTLEESLAVASQIAAALDAAHENGIVHRDLKPANIIITSDDIVKVLDFGLAKASAEDRREPAVVDSSQSPTLTRDATHTGVVLGTAAYMSPEQAKAKRVDKRTDIFAFGAVLYEMLTGKKSFPGEDGSEILAPVIKLEPDWNALPRTTPPRFSELLHRCPEKDPKKRRRDIGDVRNEIDAVLTSSDSEPTTRAPRGIAVVAAGCLIMGALGGYLISEDRTSEETRPVTHFSTRLPERDELTGLDHRAIALSPDGRTLA